MENSVISQSAFDKRRKKGLSLEECLAKTDKVVCDHKGKQFNSMRDMLKFHGVTTSVFYARKKQGLSLEKCLTKKEKVIYDHKGNHSTFYDRKKQGLSLEECLRPTNRKKH